MGKSNRMDAQHETCDYVQMHIFRVPKKNHDTIVQIGKQGHEIGNKHGMRFVCLATWIHNKYIDL